MAGTRGTPPSDDGDGYMLLFRSHPAPLLIFDVDSLRILDVNDAAVDLYGYAREEFTRLSIKDIRPPEDIPALEALLAEAGSARIEADEWRHRLRNGTVMDVRVVSEAVPFMGQDARLVSIENVTPRKQSEQQLRLLRAAFHAAANAIVITDRTGSIRWVNAAFEEMTGYSVDEVLGRNPRELLRSGHHGSDFYARLWRTILGGAVWRGRMINRARGGRLYHEEQTITPVRDGSGRITHFISVKEDVTARLATEDALKRSEERYRTLFEGVPIGLFRATPDGRFLDVNGALVRTLGHADREALIGRSFVELCEDRDEGVRFLTLAGRIGASGGEDLLVGRRDGRRIWARVRIAAEVDGYGRVTSLEGALEDVTDRRDIEDRLRFQAELLSAVGEAVIATDTSSRIIYWNHHAETIYGWSSHEVMGRDVVEVTVPPAGRADLARVYARVCAGETWSGEFDVQRRDGTTLPVHVTDAPIRDGGGRIVGVVGVSRDLTSRRALEQELRHAQKMEAVGRLAGGIAHDFNNVLTAIIGHAEFLLDGLPDGPLREDARTVYRSAERASQLTQQLLAFSRKQVLQPRVLDLGEAVQDLEGLLRPIIGEDLTLSIRVNPDAGRIAADGSQIEQVVVNLVVNARDAMPDGGVIRLSVDAADHGDVNSHVPGHVEPGPYVCLEVSDTGTGMDATVADRLFEPFFTTKPPGKGTGLGLSTVYGIVRQSGGHVGVDSRPGGGTTFRVFLPRVDDALSELPDPFDDLIPARGGETVLLVEDEAGVRTLARRVLERAGYRVVEAEAPGQALAALAAAGTTEVDLIITDVVMPEMSGVALVEKLLAIRPATPVIFMSGYAEDEALRRGMVDPRHRFIPKPFTPAALARVVSEALQTA